MIIKSILFLFLLLSFNPLSKAEETPLVKDLNQKVVLLESKISHLSESQDMIVQKNDEIKKELDNLRIWIHRNHG